MPHQIFAPETFFATVAQKVEQGFCKPQVPGSIPGGGSKREYYDFN